MCDWLEDKEFSRLLSICRIQLSESERQLIKKDVDEIISYFNSLAEVSTKGVKEAYHPIKIKEKLRDDEPSEFSDTNLILKNTKTYRFYVVGPNV